MNLFDKTTFECSKVVTTHYSTSFTLGIKTLAEKYHYPIYAIYGFVRYADEIVDTFHDFDKAVLLEEFKSEALKAIRDGISLNPILNSFQVVVKKYGISLDLIEAFLTSMEMDLQEKTYDQEKYTEYIYGSAEVVGLMCLKVFCDGDEEAYDRLKEPAQRLGAAFQKVNFLRDIKSDYAERGRIYFPGVNFTEFNAEVKSYIEKDIEADFEAAYKGIINLPDGARLGVYLAYTYYLKLFKKIRNCPASKIASKRIRIPNNIKLALLLKTYIREGLNFI